ncbi:MAG TPA: hypothetical protein PKD83_11550, partial [Ignavibacteria bacterium]|nr:hypothetical protein [Ignavibacteria bacterium]
MKKVLILISVIFISILAYVFIPGMLKPGNKLKITGSSEARKIPRVLFVTSGVDEGAGYISEGVLVAVQTFS